MDDLSKALKRNVGFQDTAGIQDASGKLVPFCRMPNGRIFPPFGPQYLGNVKSVKIRPDDTFVCGYPKSGCHWTWEVMGMILKGKPEYSQFGKVETMVELSSPEVIEASPSPRILNTHFWFEELPEEIKKYKTKIVFTTRNPKDTAVSHYNHHRNMTNIYNYDGHFNDWIPLWISGNIDYGSFLDFHLKWDKAIRENPDQPVLVLNYEDMKQDIVPSIRKLATFLGVNLTDKQVQDIAKVSDFDTMKSRYKGTPCERLIRKGQVGDWKNWFTVARSEQVDQWQEQLDQTMFRFRYSL